jgi:hypothetical protein
VHSTPAPPADSTPKTYLSAVSVGGSLRSARGKLRVRYSLSRAADVRFTITRRGSRRALASWTQRGRSGANRTTVTRRLPTGRTLKRGAYTVAVALR